MANTPGKSKRYVNRKKLTKYVENAHAKQNAALRAELATLKMQMAQQEAEKQVLKNEHSVVKSEVKKAKPFIDRQGKGRAKKSSK